jgi:ATP-binding cassette, subfamily B (MDR/TAP), member 1
MMYEEASQVANDAVSSIRTVASFSAEEKVMDLYKKKCEGPLRTGIRTGIISGIGFGVSFFLLFGVYAASFYAGARLVEDKKTTFPKVFRVSSLWLAIILRKKRWQDYVNAKSKKQDLDLMCHVDF